MDVVPVAYSVDKATIEAEVMAVFAQALSMEGQLPILPFTQNAEDDLDFTLHFPGREAKLDLMEMVFKEGTGSPYLSQEKIVYSRPFADQVFDKIISKSRSYSNRPTGEKHLLLYTTHWRYTPSDVVLALLSHKLNVTEHVFDAVMFLQRITQDEGRLRFLWPDAPLVAEFDPANYDDHFVINLPPDGFELRTHASPDS